MDIQISKKINILRAIVMGANDGIISIAGVVFGVYGASMNTWTIFLAGLTATVAGTFSMATGEYVSVNSQLDSERSAKDEQRIALVNNFSQEAQFLIQHYQTDGISEENARLLAQQSMQKDALGETLHARYGINEDDFISPAEAAIASMMAFPLGAILPMVGMIFVPMTYRVVITLIFVIFALVLTGYFSAVYGNTPKKTMILRNVLMGLLTMSVTYLIGLLMAA
ncbi:VIT1/CCC1 transporter family protein [Leuconostoc mesenteroides]|uniref:VIT1/CCC1 transporter family protein n=3 Tax=Leuconostoc mesenteroides TaxID=1245 RepID=UPI00235DF41B|nr:VIT family protein [Leuconostoc mesenteroides]